MCGRGLSVFGGGKLAGVLVLTVIVEALPAASSPTGAVPAMAEGEAEELDMEATASSLVPPSLDPVIVRLGERLGIVESLCGGTIGKRAVGSWRSSASSRRSKNRNRE